MNLKGIMTNVLYKNQLTKLNPDEEFLFKNWYKNVAQQNELNPNPDDYSQQYDYRGHYQAKNDNPFNKNLNPQVNKNDNRVHFTDQFKLSLHPAFWTKMIPDGEQPSPEVMQYWQNINGLPKGGW